MITDSQKPANIQCYRSSTKAFSLVEVMVAMFIFSFVSLGLIYSILQSRRQAENLVYDNVSLSLAQGYIEQMRSLGYYELYAASLTSGSTLDTVSVGVVSGTLNTQIDPITLGVVNRRDIIVDVVDDGSSATGKTMFVEFTPTVTTITSVFDVDALLVKLSYTYTLDALASGGTRTKTSELRSVVANID